jgi:hypothetical protein
MRNIGDVGYVVYNRVTLYHVWSDGTNNFHSPGLEVSNILHLGGINSVLHVVPQKEIH